jgi:hypothetical protein
MSEAYELNVYRRYGEWFVVPAVAAESFVVSLRDVIPFDGTLESLVTAFVEGERIARKAQERPPASASTRKT